jgi:AcrR family transcriptional regulator
MSTPADTAPIGLRERKKIRTRAAIRDNAMRLFREQGYTATTVDQIAEAADVSPSTFFRYFPNKEAVVLADDVDPVVIRALQDADPDLTPVAAVRQALVGTFGAMDEDALAFESARQALINSEPELRSAMIDDFRRNVALLGTAMAARTGRSPDSLEVKVFAGAIIGALLAAADGLSDFPHTVDAALALLEQGLPL